MVEKMEESPTQAASVNLLWKLFPKRAGPVYDGFFSERLSRYEEYHKKRFGLEEIIDVAELAGALFAGGKYSRGDINKSELTESGYDVIDIVTSEGADTSFNLRHGRRKLRGFLSVYVSSANYCNVQLAVEHRGSEHVYKVEMDKVKKTNPLSDFESSFGYGVRFSDLIVDGVTVI